MDVRARASTICNKSPNSHSSECINCERNRKEMPYAALTHYLRTAYASAPFTFSPCHLLQPLALRRSLSLVWFSKPSIYASEATTSIFVVPKHTHTHGPSSSEAITSDWMHNKLHRSLNLFRFDNHRYSPAAIMHTQPRLYWMLRIMCMHVMYAPGPYVCVCVYILGSRTLVSNSISSPKASHASNLSGFSSCWRRDTIELLTLCTVCVCVCPESDGRKELIGRIPY